MFFFNKNKKGELEKKIDKEIEINGICFIYETDKDGMEEVAAKIAKIYESKINDIVKFMLDNGFPDVFGEMSSTKIIESLGRPTIDLDRGVISYLEQTLDDAHILDIEYGGTLEKIFYFSIDG